MNKKKIIIIISIIVGALVIVGLYGTFATSSTTSGSDNEYAVTLTGSTGEVVVPAGKSKTVIYQITNTNKGIVQYGITYSGDNITVKYYTDSPDSHTGTIDYGENKFIKLYVKNSGTSDSILTIKAILGYENGGSLDSLIPSGYNLVSEGYTPYVNLIDHITNLYVENYEMDYYFADGSGTNYFAPSVRLMNDGLYSTGDYVNGADAINGTAGNIRYYGANDSNLSNYIYFNCSDYSNQSSNTCETWRIIGIVDGKVKIIRNSSIGEYDDDGVGISSWNNSSVKDMLNSGTYYSELQSKNSKTVELISESTWYTNTMSSTNVFADESYIAERTGDATWIGKIALAYPSDYGYAADLYSTAGGNGLYYYNEDWIKSTNWLTNIFNSDYTYWLLTRGNCPWGLLTVYNGSVTCYDGVKSDYNVIPVLHLKSELRVYSETNGSYDNPYKLVVK